ncbi:MAG: HAMP domain-containing histidine kinase [Nitratireductor sp.]|nr:HAMP domain-containing histidine kinase [Nitratireductor sp.]MCC0021615.1 HAMP domain-containing histidine kinase [Nitratireductor sp.]
MRSIRLRLVSVSIILIAAALGLVWYSLSTIFEKKMADQLILQLQGTVDHLSARLVYDQNGPSLESEPGDPRYELPGGGRYWQVEFSDGTTFRSRSLWDVKINREQTKPVGTGNLFSVEGPNGNPLLLLDDKVSLEVSDGVQDIHLLAAMDKSEYDTAVRDFNSQLALMLTITGIALSLGSLLQVIIGLSPLRTLENSIEAVRSGDERRVSEDGPIEVQPLVSGLNHLLDIREADVAKSRNRAADLAHGIKTPLTILSQYAENLALAGDGADAELLSGQIQAIQSRVDRQLALTRMAANANSQTELKPLVSTLVDIVKRLPSEKELTWSISIKSDLTVPVEHGDLAEALGNLLDNARKWANSEVRISATQNTGQLEIRIEDDGQGVDTGHLEEILGRGVRLDEKNGETGLGLAITLEIVEAYGGKFRVERSELGGLLLILEFSPSPDRSVFTVL